MTAMKIIHLLSFISLSASNLAYGQFSTDSKNGTNALLLNSGTASINITDPKISLDWTNRLRYVEPRNFDGFLGFGASAKNKTGIGKIVDNDAIAPEAELHGVFGFYFSNAKTEIEKHPVENDVIEYRIDNDALLRQAKSDRRNELIAGYAQKLCEYSDRIANFPFKAMVDKLEEQIDLRRYADKFQKVNSTVPGISASTLDLLQPEIQKVYDEINKQPLVKEVQDKIVEQRRLTPKSPYYRIDIFGFGNVNASSFKKYMANDTTNLEKSFKDEKFKGGKFGFGANGQYKIFRFGITYAFNYSNNFKGLTETEYVVRKSPYVGPASAITTEKKITAYDGDYAKVNVEELNVDLIANIKLNQKATNFLLINPYSHSFFSRKKDKLPSTWDLGVGFYSFKSDGKFLGGLYVEIPDIKNAVEKNKEPSKQDLKPVIKRFVIGLTAKFTLQGIYSW